MFRANVRRGIALNHGVLKNLPWNLVKLYIFIGLTKNVKNQNFYCRKPGKLFVFLSFPQLSSGKEGVAGLTANLPFTSAV